MTSVEEAHERDVAEVCLAEKQLYRHQQSGKGSRDGSVGEVLASMRMLVHISRTQVFRAAHIYNPRRGCKWEGRQREGGRGGIRAKVTREGRRGQGRRQRTPGAQWLQFRQTDEIQGQWETLSKNKVHSQWGRPQTLPSSLYMHAQVHICPIHEHT